jgi:hypothetical protein
VLDDDGLHGLGMRLPGLHICGQDLVAGFQLADRDGGAGGQQDLRAGAEAVITARVDVIPVSPGVGEVAAGVFCGKDQGITSKDQGSGIRRALQGRSHQLHP